MVNNQFGSSNINKQHAKDEFKICASRYCNNRGTIPLKIIYIKKTGFFCNKCKEELIKLKLVENIGER